MQLNWLGAGSGKLSLRLAVPESNVETDDVLEPSHQGVAHMSQSCLAVCVCVCGWGRWRRAETSGGWGVDEAAFSFGNCVFQQYGYCGKQRQKE